MSEILDNPYPNRIQDPEKAHAMALEGDYTRTKARNCRLANFIVRQFLIDGKALDKAGSDWVSLKHETGDKLSRISPTDWDGKIYPDFGQDFTFSDWGMKRYAEGEGLDEKWQEMQDCLQGVFNIREKEAIQFEEGAKPIEYWAGVLHDNPINENYVTTHPEVDFTPLGLIDLKEQAREARQEAKEAQKALNSFVLKGWMSKNLALNIASQCYVGYDEFEICSSPDKEACRLLDNDSITMGELKAHYKTSAERHAARTLALSDKLTKVLEDVRRGRATA